ncbi:E3 ubiquitin-protein ligase TRIM56 [Holothuria leucospilota]|uniref:E3 ubiquitin-protein ligase TRIM56 n=1 Tax=Holothuria leucospilota TaxID=206669 RepID=A0A9Q1BL07_HOLLE|nr:E3 ubiquitin-protein ligase TRIM56 [Holothuria leucospilota]
MSSTAETYEDVLSCPICMETLDTPKILTCGHSLCLTPCLAEIVKQPDPVCPLCRTAIVLPPSGKIEDIATNVIVKSLLEILEKTDYVEKTSTGIPCHTQEDGDYVCMTCLEQICSCCQLSFHIDNTHDYIPASEFTENVQQDVSKARLHMQPIRRESAKQPTHDGRGCEVSDPGSIVALVSYPRTCY